MYRWDDALGGCWRRLIDCYGDVRRHAFFESRPRRQADPLWAYNWGMGAMLAAAGATHRQCPDQVLSSADWDLIRGATLGYRRARPGFSSTSRVRRGVPGGAFYDDNAWIGLASLDLADHSPFEQIAGSAYRFVLEGQDVSGGIFWNERRQSLHVCSTGPAAVLGARLYLSGVEVGLAPVEAMLRWLDSMRADDGRYFDNVRLHDGSVEQTFHTYNCGTPLHAMALMEGVAGLEFRSQVEQTLNALPKFLSASGELPTMPWFNAVLLRGLLAVYQTYGIESPLFGVYQRTMQEALHVFYQGDQPLNLPSRDSRGGVLLRDAAASVEILALLATFSRIAPEPSADG